MLVMLMMYCSGYTALERIERPLHHFLLVNKKKYRRILSEELKGKICSGLLRFYPYVPPSQLSFSTFMKEKGQQSAKKK